MWKKPNYELKAKLLNEVTILEDYKKVSRSYYSFIYNVESETVLSLDKARELEMFYEKFFPEEWKECRRISLSHRKRVLRLRRRITEMVLFSDCLFLTLTWKNSDLARLSPGSRRYYVKSFLNSLNVPYVANIDFGKKNHREHYHAVVGVDKIDYSKWNKKFGSINGIKIRNETDDLKRISKYIAKLTNHAIKETVGRNAVMYSRRKFACIDRKFYLLDKKTGEVIYDN